MNHKNEGTSGRRNAKNGNLHAAKREKNDEFFSRYEDIDAEINAYVGHNPDVFRNKTILLPCDDHGASNFTKYFSYNFERFGLKKLISTSCSKGSGNRQSTLFEPESHLFDKEKHETHGKLFVLSHDIEFSGYLEGDGDFRSEEVIRLREEADIVITNPPFSLFREFITWIMEGKKQFIIMGNKNAIAYKEVFPLLKENVLWVGYTSINGGRWMILPKDVAIQSDKAKDDGKGNKILNVSGVCWFTNIEHGKRHEFLQLDTMKHNLKYNKKLQKKLLDAYGTVEYPHYDNYDAIEVPMTECIPSDYGGEMGVPITFMDKYNPEQFEIIGSFNASNQQNKKSDGYVLSKNTLISVNGKESFWNGPVVNKNPLYKRIVIRLRNPNLHRKPKGKTP